MSRQVWRYDQYTHGWFCFDEDLQLSGTMEIGHLTFSLACKFPDSFWGSTRWFGPMMQTEVIHEYRCFHELAVLLHFGIYKRGWFCIARNKFYEYIYELFAFSEENISNKVDWFELFLILATIILNLGFSIPTRLDLVARGSYIRLISS